MSNTNDETQKATNANDKNDVSKENDDIKMHNENLRFLLGHKLSNLNIVSTVCMSWWVSSIVFCGSILAAVWLRRTELVESNIIVYLAFFVACFFASFIYF